MGEKRVTDKAPDNQTSCSTMEYESVRKVYAFKDIGSFSIPELTIRRA